MSIAKPSICFYCADQNPHRDRSLGITNYTHNLIAHLHQSDKVTLQALVSKSSSGVPDGISKTIIPFRTDHIRGRLWADHFHPLMIRRSIEADVWHYPKGFLPFGAQVRRPKVGTIADTILQFYADNYPRYRSRASYTYWIAMLKNSIRRCDLILTVSEFSKRSILEFAARYRLKEPKVLVTYQGADADQAEAKPKSDYVLHLASTQPHKRTTWLLREWQNLQSGHDLFPRLRLIGRLDQEASEIAAGLKKVEVFPPANREQVLAAMTGALALILSSQVEGFGLPALEAYSSGTPVVYVKGTAVEEILGADSQGGFTLEENSLSQALSQVLNMGAADIDMKSAELRDRFAWSKCVDRTLAGYRMVFQR